MTEHVHYWVIPEPDGREWLPGRCIAKGKCPNRRRRLFRSAVEELASWEERKTNTWNNRTIKQHDPSWVY